MKVFAKSFLSFWLLLSLCLSSCGIARTQLEPKCTYYAQKKDLRTLPSSFPPLTPEERKSDWGREMVIADGFAHDLDYYRAITTYRRALFLLPSSATDRYQQIEYDMILCYYLAHHFAEAIQSFEESSLTQVGTSFSAVENLLVLLYDSYREVGFCDKAEQIISMIEHYSPGTALDLTLFVATQTGDIPYLQRCTQEHPLAPSIQRFLTCYCQNAKSPSRARFLNVILPGAGYYYVGQKKSALTSFLLNAAFIAAAYQFFKRGYWAAGAITTSFEFGWYVGGINGAGLEAQEYNNRLYECYACPLMTQQKLFPILTFQKVF